jgi:hypothetical protein
MRSPGKLTVQRLLIAVFWSAVAIVSCKAFVEYDPWTAGYDLWPTLIVVCIASVGAAIGGLLGRMRKGFLCGLGTGIIPGLLWYWIMLGRHC